MDFWVFGIILITAAAVARVVPVIPLKWRVPSALAVVFALLIIAPFAPVDLEGFRLLQLSKFAIWTIVAIGLNMLTGYNGQISLGHGAFMLLGAYTAVILLDQQEQLGFIDSWTGLNLGIDSTPWPFWTTIIMGGIMAGILGLLIGFPALRLSGPYLAIATLALIISAPQIIRKYDEVTGGAQGLIINQPPPPPGLENQLDSNEWMYFLTMGVAIVMLLIAWGILQGRLGRAFTAVRDSEVAASAMGVNVARTKIIAFTISAFYAGVAGALLTLLLEVMTPESVRIEESINFLTAIVIGGLGSILGSVIGALVITFIPDISDTLSDKLPFVPEEVLSPGALQGVLVIVVVLLMPYGIAGAFHRLAQLTPRKVADTASEMPRSARRRFREFREDLAWSWENRPFTSPRDPPAEPKEGG